MNIKELKQHFRVFKWDDVYMLSSFESGRRFAGGKFLWTIKRFNKTKFYVEGYEPTNKIEVLVQNVNDKVATLPYDSEYYMYNIRKGFKEECIIHDYLIETLGFNCNRFGRYYDYNNKNPYQLFVTNFSLCFSGLETSRENENEDFSKRIVQINLYGSKEFEWISSECKFDIEEIKKCIDSLIKPLLISESVSSFLTSEKCINNGNIDILLKSLTNMCTITSIDYKTTLKEKLLKLAESL